MMTASKTKKKSFLEKSVNTLHLTQYIMFFSYQMFFLLANGAFNPLKFDRKQQNKQD